MPVATRSVIGVEKGLTAPTAGSVPMTLPFGWALSSTCWMVPTVNPAPCSAVVAACWVNPTTFGIAAESGPADTSIVTVDPTATCGDGGSASTGAYKIETSTNGVAFVDAGNIFGKGEVWNGLKMGYGFGLRFDTPVGLLRGDVGFPTDKVAARKSLRWYFGFGHIF